MPLAKSKAIRSSPSAVPTSELGSQASRTGKLTSNSRNASSASTTPATGTVYFARPSFMPACLNELLSEHRIPYADYYTGFSQGGAQAHIAGVIMNKPVISFSAFRCMDPFTAKEYASDHVRYRLRGDQLPHIIPSWVPVKWWGWIPYGWQRYSHAGHSIKIGPRPPFWDSLLAKQFHRLEHYLEHTHGL